MSGPPFKAGEIIVGHQAQHNGLRLIVLKALPGGAVKARGIGPLASHWRKRETYLSRGMLEKYRKERP